MTTQRLAGRRVLVTAGPTWVWIDAVRHLGNVSSGRTGLAVSRAFATAGAHVTVLLGPGQAVPTPEDHALLQVERFITFDDLHREVRSRVGSRTFDALIHAAAVSDYRPVSEERGKLASGESELVLRLQPTPKIVDEVRSLDPNVLLVKFKLEVGRTLEELLHIAAESRARSDADLIVANDLRLMDAVRHPAWILDAGGIVAEAATTAELADKLVQAVTERLGRRPTSPDAARSSAIQGVV